MGACLANCDAERFLEQEVGHELWCRGERRARNEQAFDDRVVIEKHGAACLNGAGLDGVKAEAHLGSGVEVVST